MINLLSSGKTCAADLITHHYKLEEINEAFKTARDRTRAIKVILDME
ncbi:MAG: hypothetical protein LBQ57_13660 [Spirochaetales bacterium]|nr:hypothetical protein [Spirochaetales bacterium]